MSKKEFLSTAELAKILGISRIAVFKRIKKGDITAIKIGRNYAIPVENVQGDELRKKNKIQVEKAVEKVVSEYGEVLRKLGNSKNGDD
ncbi:MAG: helix-turn-helix domain-containing protein [Candidatus Omnitrophota bacterium]|nr:helix-turn-helix domain-containing protein [Candidatus Omnitrophota bacterium]MBU2528742.1 helix-turn-helix domain-containing protein [bacterium]MBU3929367.1 helix-turn-helix domain-containing protein [bacterium]